MPVLSSDKKAEFAQSSASARRSTATTLTSRCSTTLRWRTRGAQAARRRLHTLPRPCQPGGARIGDGGGWPPLAAARGFGRVCLVADFAFQPRPPRWIGDDAGACRPSSAAACAADIAGHPGERWSRGRAGTERLIAGNAAVAEFSVIRPGWPVAERRPAAGRSSADIPVQRDPRRKSIAIAGAADEPVNRILPLLGIRQATKPTTPT